ncbi:flagellar biosynthetic protein FliR [Eionea flava]
MLSLFESDFIAWISQYFLPLARLSAFFLAAPIFSVRVVSTRIRLVLAVSVTVLIAPILPPTPIIATFGLESVVVVAQQLLIGVALGFTFQIVFQLFVLAGQYIAMKLGLGFASMNDPSNGVSVTIVSQFYLLTTTLLFISINGHLVLIQILVESFTTIPIGPTGLSTSNIYRIVELGGWMFGSALVISLPVLTALLVVNSAFGVMSRSAPQMNIFAVGFPITLIFGLMIMWVGFPQFLSAFELFVDEGIAFAMTLLSP